jgi:hypothetical protein
VPEAVSLLLALVCTVAIVTLFLWPLWAPLLRARRLRAWLDRHRRAPRHSAG